MWLSFVEKTLPETVTYFLYLCLHHRVEYFSWFYHIWYMSYLWPSSKWEVNHLNGKPLYPFFADFRPIFRVMVLKVPFLTYVRLTKHSEPK